MTDTDALDEAVAGVLGLTQVAPGIYVDDPMATAPDQLWRHPSTMWGALMAAVDVLTTKYGKHHSFSLMTHDSTGAEPGLWWAAFWVGNPGPGKVLFEAYADDGARAVAKCIHAVVKDD